MALRELSCLIEHDFYVKVLFPLHTFLDNLVMRPFSQIKVSVDLSLLETRKELFSVF